MKQGNAVKDSVTKSLLKRKGVKEFCTYAAAAGIMCYISNPSEWAEISFNDHFSGMVQAVQLSAESAEFY